MPLQLQLILLAAACLGAFLSRFSSPVAPTYSWATVWTVLVTGAVTYLAMDSGMVPDAWQIAAANSPLKASVVAFVVSGLGGSVLVDKAQDIITAVSAPKKPAPPGGP